MRGKRTFVTTSLASMLAFFCLTLILASPVIGQDGKKLYGDRCALCHGSGGDGKGVIMQTAPFDAGPVAQGAAVAIELLPILADDRRSNKQCQAEESKNACK